MMKTGTTMKGTAKKLLNFGSGPAAIPEEVLHEASEAVLDYDGSGLSILEIPHRGKLFDNILEESKALVLDLCDLNTDYKVLWLQGGGRLQFSMIPMNFLGDTQTAGYVESGHWASEAAAYALYYGKTEILASSKEDNYNHLPPFPAHIAEDIAYVHFTTNNTIYGTQWQEIPKVNAPIIADMSSDILSRKRAYNNCAMFYAVAQKNIGPAGATLVVVHQDMLGRIERTLPPMLDYREQVKHNSVLNTPPVFAIYASLLTLRWTKKKTLALIERESIEKAGKLSSALERSEIFNTVVANENDRSRMNICFTANNNGIEKGFLDFCTLNGITGIEGHRSVGGFRVSLYNAITSSDVDRFISVMQEFEQQTLNTR